MLFVLGEKTHIDAQAVADQGDSVWVRQPGDICWLFESFFFTALAGFVIFAAF